MKTAWQIARYVIGLGLVAFLTVTASVLPASGLTRSAQARNAHAKAGQWRVMSAPAPLAAVACWRLGACLALTDTEPAPEWETLSNGRWQPGGEFRSYVPSGVTQMVCPAANSCWALGYSLNSRGTYYGGRFLRYHQASLTDEVPPAPPGATASSGIGLVSISCSSASFCVAVGYFYPSGVTEDRPVLEMFANGVWSLKPVPLPRYSNPANGAELDSVSCTPGNHCVAVGSYNTDQNGESQALILTVSAHHVSEIRAPLPPQAIASGRQTATAFVRVVHPKRPVCGRRWFHKQGRRTTRAGRGQNARALDRAARGESWRRSWWNLDVSLMSLQWALCCRWGYPSVHWLFLFKRRGRGRLSKG